jgi:hypothetical protein
MTEQTEAQRIADWFEGGYGGCEMEAAAELRRMEAVIQQLLEALEKMFASIPPYRHDGSTTIPEDVVDFANAAIAAAKGGA